MGIGTIRAATAAALPPLEPPVERPLFHGLGAGPRKADSVETFNPNSGVLVRPTVTRPAALYRLTSSLS